MTSLVTRCPACGTLFKVVPDQLRISEGWVRCGQCDEVFDAQAHMQPPMELVPDASSSPEGAYDAAANSRQHSNDDSAAGTSDSIVVDAGLIAASVASAAVADVPLIEREKAGAPTVQGAVVGGSETLDLTDEEPTSSGASGRAQPKTDTGDAGASPSLREAATETATAGMSASFLKSMPKAAPRWVRWTGIVAVLVLALGLLVQVLVQQRERIAATAPALAPMVAQLSHWGGVQMGPLRQIESVVIESSAFVKVKADVYRLSFAVKNTAMVPVALPFAELTLTDLRDQSMLRKVLSPAEYGAKGTTLDPGEELSLVVPVAVKTTVAVGEKITGYRLLVFYP